MEPVSIILGLVSLGSAVVGLFSQANETSHAQAVADAEVAKAKQNAVIAKIIDDAKALDEADQAEADVLAAQVKTAKAAQARAQLQKQLFATVALLALAGAVFIFLKNKSLLAT